MKIFSALLIFAVIQACGSVDKNESPSNNSLASTDALSISDAQSKNVIDLKTAPGGTYLVDEIKTYTESKAGLKSLARHKLLYAGDLNSIEAFEIKSVWQTKDGSKADTSISTEINLPTSFVTTGSDIEFKNKHYYWLQAFSNGGQKFLASSGEETKGINFWAIFGAQPTGPLYSRGQETAIATQDGSTLTIQYRRVGSDTNVVFHISYKKK